MIDRNEFDPTLYLERDVDRALWNKLNHWVQDNNKTHWVTLDSGPGRGNTSILQRIHSLATSASNFKLGVRVLLIKSGESNYDRQPSEVNPLAYELFTNYSQGRLSPWRRLKLRLHHADSSQLAKVGLVLIVGLLLSSIFVGFHQYITTINARFIDVHLWFTPFWVEYLPLHWTDFFFWFISGSIAGLPFSMAALYMARNRFLPHKGSVTPVEEDFEYLRSRRGLIYSLHEICRDRRSVLFLVDDAHCLPKVEKQFLHELFNPPSKEHDIQRFREDHNVMIVSVDTRQDTWQDLLPSNLQKASETLKVPEFTLIELRDIAKAQLPSSNGTGRLKDDEVESLIEEAQRHANVKLLFASRYQHRVEH